MKFHLFSKIEFEVADPIALVECFCIQTNFYSSYDLLLPNRTIEDVSKIGARIDRDKLPACKRIIKSSEKIPVFQIQLDNLLAQDDKAIKNHVIESSEVIIRLMDQGIGLSQALKILHTVYPGIMPMIDSYLQEQYRLHIDPCWKSENPEQLLYDYYLNLKSQTTRKNLDDVYKSLKLPCLTKIRVFDIIWWSYLRSNSLTIKYRTVKLTTIS